MLFFNRETVILENFKLLSLEDEILLEMCHFKESLVVYIGINLDLLQRVDMVFELLFELFLLGLERFSLKKVVFNEEFKFIEPLELVIKHI